MPVPLLPASAGYLYRVVAGLYAAGWDVTAIPTERVLLRNGQRLTLNVATGELRYRIFVYKIGGPQRRRNPSALRIEITSTYRGNLSPLEGVQDAVLGYHEASDVFVGFDPTRLYHGGDEANASSRFDVQGVALANTETIVVVPRPSQLLGVERHAFLKPVLLGDYLPNIRAIHDGDYRRGTKPTIRRVPSRLEVPASAARGDSVILEAPVRSRRARTPVRRDVESYEADRRLPRRTTLEEFRAIQARCEENGELGERFALSYEQTRLRRAGRANLADRVTWVSRDSVGEGYDIHSFETNGVDRFIEVKSTQGASVTFDMSENEWSAARRLGAQYHIYRVSNVRSDRPTLFEVPDPVTREAAGELTKTASGWRVTV